MIRYVSYIFMTVKMSSNPVNRSFQPFARSLLLPLSRPFAFTNGCPSCDPHCRRRPPLRPYLPGLQGRVLQKDARRLRLDPMPTREQVAGVVVLAQVNTVRLAVNGQRENPLSDDMREGSLPRW